MAPDVQIIGDEIWSDGYLIGVLVQSGTPASVLSEFEVGMMNATLFEGVGCDLCEGTTRLNHEKHCKHYEDPRGCGGPAPGEEESEYTRAMSDLLRSLKPFNKGGLIKYSDLERIAAELKEDEENDQ